MYTNFPMLMHRLQKTGRRS